MAGGQVTEWLARWRAGDRVALERLIPLVYDELRQVARRQINRESPGHTLSATALVHEVYLRLLHQRKLAASDRMLSRRRRPDDEADPRRSRQSPSASQAGRPRPSHPAGDAHDVPLLTDAEAEEVLAIDLALERLAQIDERAHRVIECRIFAGLTLDETAQALSISSKSVQRTWTTALAWLRKEMRDERLDEALSRRLPQSGLDAITGGRAMDRTPWGRIEEVFELAQAQPVEARPRVLAEACGTDAALRSELEAMLLAAGEIARSPSNGWSSTARQTAGFPDPWLDTCLGPWRILDVLGRGGMGTVYRAERADGQYRQEVAVKLVRTGPCDPYAIERFRTERQVLAHLRHPHIAGCSTGASPLTVRRTWQWSSSRGCPSTNGAPPSASARRTPASVSSRL